MSYERQGDIVTLDITVDDFEELLLMAGFAMGSVWHNKPLFYSWIRLANKLNDGNPNFTRYEIPPEFVTRSTTPAKS